MKLEYIRSSFDAFSAKASDLSRQMGLAGIAVIWLFKIDHKEATPTLPADLYWPLVCFCAGLLTDILQYIYGAIAWALVLTRSGKQKDKDEIPVPDWINNPTWCFFTLKILFCLAGYIGLLDFLLHKL